MAFQLTAGEAGSSVLDSSLWNPWLWTFWFSTIPINFSLAAQGGVQTVINIGSVPVRMRALAQGVTTSVQFLFGYAGGAILPSVLLDVSYKWSLRYLQYEMTEADLLANGVLVVCSMTLPLFFSVYLAEREAFR